MITGANTFGYDLQACYSQFIPAFFRLFGVGIEII